MNIEVRRIDHESAAEWDSFVRRSVRASHYHQYEWRNFFAGYFGKDTYYLAAYRDQSVVGVLPLVRQKSLLFGDYLVSLPFLNYGGILADEDSVAGMLADHAADLAARLNVSHLELREFKQRPGLHCRTDKITMHLDLPATEAELARNLGSKRRSQIKRPLREGPVVRTGGIELVDQFYEVFSRNMRDLGTPVYAKSMFVDILERFSEDSTILVIELSGRPIAAAFLIHYRGKTEVPWASTDKRFNRISVNMYLYWEMLKFSINRGSTIFDFGRSTKGSGTYRFKRQWGARPLALYWNYWLKEGENLPEINPENPKYGLAIEIWKRLPLRLAKVLGPRIVSYLP